MTFPTILFPIRHDATQRVLDILQGAAEVHESVLSEPEPTAVFDGFGESSLDFRLLYWVPMDNLLQVKTEMNLAVHAAMKDAGVRVAFPRRDLRIRDAAGLAANPDKDDQDGGGLGEESID